MPNAFAVTAAIPAYNEGARIRTAIESARSQTEPPVEILVVDDGSTDETARIAANLGARVVSQSNAGIARTRNRLLREARSPWLAFLDADDVWYPEKLARVRIAHEAASDVDLLFGDLLCRYVSGKLAASSVFRTTPQYAALPKTPVARDVSRLDRSDLGRALAVGNFIGTSTVVVRRDRIVERGILFAEDLPATPDFFVAEDVEWYLRLLKTTDAAVSTHVLGEYVWRDASLSSDYGRTRYGDVKLGERVGADPSAYVDGIASVFAAERRSVLRHAARIHARSGDFARSRALLREAQSAGSDPRDAAALAILDVATVARELWKRVPRPHLV